MKNYEMRNELYTLLSETIYLSVKSQYSSFMGQDTFNKMGVFLSRISLMLSNPQLLSFFEKDCSDDLVYEYQNICEDVEIFFRDIFSSAKNVGYSLNLLDGSGSFSKMVIDTLDIPKPVMLETKKDELDEFLSE